MKINVLSKLLILSLMALLLSACGNEPLTGESGTNNATGTNPTNSGFICSALTDSNDIQTGAPANIQFNCNDAFVIVSVTGSGTPTTGTQTAASNGGVTFTVSFASPGVQTLTVLASESGNTATTNAQPLIFSVGGAATNPTTTPQPLICSAVAASNVVTLATKTNGTLTSSTEASSPFTINVTTNRSANITSVALDASSGGTFAQGFLPGSPGTTLAISGNTVAGRAGVFNVKVTVTDSTTSSDTATCYAAVAATTPSATNLSCTLTAGSVTTPVNAQGVPTAASSATTFTASCSKGKNLQVTAVGGPEGSSVSGLPAVNNTTITATGNLGLSVGAQPVTFTIGDGNGNTTTVSAIVTANPQTTTN